MPTYQYACTACAERLEVVQRYTDDPLAECPSCGGALRKVFSPVGVVFKGSGFYKTDSRSSSSSSSTPSKSADPAPASPASSAAPSSSDSGAAAPATPAPASSTDTPKAAAG
ncbi:MAG TPA: FmdB family zinc ribbon protein [Frankiaceae bacterium]|nr:FmdB family zinc ribbon protein [Frankiaceae bacterium]